MKFQLASSDGARPACVADEINFRNLQNVHRINNSVLGQVRDDDRAKWFIYYEFQTIETFAF